MTEIQRRELGSQWAGASFDAEAVAAEPMTAGQRDTIASIDRDGDGALCEAELDALFTQLDHADGRDDEVATLDRGGERTSAGRLYDLALLASIGGIHRVHGEGASGVGLEGSTEGPSIARARTLLRDASRCRASLEAHRASFGVPQGGFHGQVSLEQHGQPRIYWAMAHLRTEGAKRTLAAGLDRADDVFADRALLLAVTMRERPSAWTARGTEHVDSYAEGGLDHLGADLPRMEGLVPAHVLRGWHAQERAEGLEHGRTHAIAPALVPARDQLLAYAATLRLREQTFESHVREVFGDRADGLLARMSPDARRAWVQATFGRPGRTHYDAEHQRFERSTSGHERPSAFGALERLAAEAARTGTEPDLDAIFTDPMLSRHATFQRARTTALEARAMQDAGLAGAS